jgi:transposase
MNRLSKKQKWFKMLNITQEDKVYVGLDVHKKSIAVAIWYNDRIDLTFTMPADYVRLARKLEPLRKALRRVVYEAGPTGFGLARHLKNAGFSVQVIAPANTPRPSKRQSKTDRLDCSTLAEYAAKGLLHPVALPTEQEEADRQLLRLRDQLVGKRRRVRQQIKSFLLQHSLPEPSDASWSDAFVEALHNLSLLSALRFTLDQYLEEMHHLTHQIQQTESELRELAQKDRHHQTVQLLRTHPGVGEVTSLAFALELFQPHRFAKPSEIAGFVGLAPTLHQSGQTSREGPITKTGRRQFRSCLIQAAWAWMRCDPWARELFYKLSQQTGHPNKAVVALARRLAIHLWRMACDQKPYRQPA